VTARLTHERLLTVDDSAHMRQLVSFTLTSAGYDVQEAADGRAALEMVQRQRFGLILIDLEMPRLDGMSLIRALRSLPEYRFTPLLVLTSSLSAERQADAHQAGATAWLQKPFQPDQLIQTVRRLIG